jgi:hypothetical protein
MIDTVSNIVKDRVKRKNRLSKKKRKKQKKVPDENKEKTPRSLAKQEKTEVAETKTSFEKVVEHESIQPSILLSVSVTPNSKIHLLRQHLLRQHLLRQHVRPIRSQTSDRTAVSATPVVAEKAPVARKKTPREDTRRQQEDNNRTSCCPS